jgi:hypothetical protein
MNLIPILPEISLFVGALFILMLDVFFAKKIKSFFWAYYPQLFVGLSSKKAHNSSKRAK